MTIFVEGVRGTGIANRIPFWTSTTDIGADAVITDGAGGWSSIVFASFGATPSLTGEIRLANNTSLRYRNGADTSDIQCVHMSGANTLTLGNTLTGNTTLNSGPAGILLNTVNVPRVEINATRANFALSLNIDDTAATEMGLAGAVGVLDLRLGGAAGGATRPTFVRIDAGTLVQLETVGANRFQFSSSQFLLSVVNQSFSSGVGTVLIQHQATAVASGGTFSIVARDSTQAGSTGASLIERSGDGLVADGEVLLSKGTTTSLLGTADGLLELGGLRAAGARPANITIAPQTLFDVTIAGASVFDARVDKVDCKEPLFRSANGSFVEETLTAGRTIVETTDPDTLLLDPNGVDRLVTLPAEAASDGLFYWIRNTGIVAANLDVQDDTPTAIVSIPNGSGALLKCNGVAWRQSGGERLTTLHALIEDRAPVESTASDTFVTLASAAATTFSGRPLLCFVSVMLFPTVANTGVQFAIQIDAGADAVASQMLLQETEHSAVPGQVIVTPTAGSHTLRIRWRRMGGAGTLTLDANDQILLHAIEL
ncbi:hypothetical protein LCGC14_1022830 [marine sediment metagenome]|uniref:Uncharacterized protein n=1 Tax=marine sediment metagenome TaxID=412755 RepID=A0A0F9N1H0_9ZZZZ